MIRQQSIINNPYSFIIASDLTCHRFFRPIALLIRRYRTFRKFEFTGLNVFQVLFSTTSSVVFLAARSFDWNNFLKKKLSFLSGNCQPTEMGQREKGESESEVEVTASCQVRIFFVKFCKVFEKIIASLMGVTEFRTFVRIPSVLRKFAL